MGHQVLDKCPQFLDFGLVSQVEGDAFAEPGFGGVPTA